MSVHTDYVLFVSLFSFPFHFLPLLRSPFSLLSLYLSSISSSFFSLSDCPPALFPLSLLPIPQANSRIDTADVHRRRIYPFKWTANHTHAHAQHMCMHTNSRIDSNSGHIRPYHFPLRVA